MNCLISSPDKKVTCFLLILQINRNGFQSQWQLSQQFSSLWMKSFGVIINENLFRGAFIRYYVIFSIFYDFSWNVIFRKNFLMSMVYPSSPLLSPARSVFRKENSLVPSGTSSFKTILLYLFFLLSLFTENHPWNHGKERFFEHRGQLTIT